MKDPFITVIISGYLRKEYILEAAKSVVNQGIERACFELIVLRSFNDKKIDEQLLEMGATIVDAERLPLGEALANAVEISKGEVLSFLDDDDLFLPNKLSKVMKLFTEKPDLFYLHNSQTFCDKDSLIIPYQENKHRYTGDLIISNRNFLDLIRKLKRTETNLGALLFNLSSICVRKNIFIGKFDFLRRIKSHPDDFMFFLTLSYSGEIFLMNYSEKLTIYRIHDNSLTNAFMSLSDKALTNFRLKQITDYVTSSKVIVELMNGTKFSPISEALYSFDSATLYNIKKHSMNLIIETYRLWSKRYLVLMERSLRRRLILYTSYFIFALFYFLSSRFPAIKNLGKVFPNVESFRR